MEAYFGGKLQYQEIDYKKNHTKEISLCKK